ncbi:MAG: diguanylate cyclase [Syntrophomonas sp.]
MLQKAMQFFLGNEKDFDLEHRVFNFYCILGLFVSLLTFLIICYLDLPLIAGISMLVFFVFALFCWYLSRFRRLFRISTFMAVSVLIFVLTPGLWILNSGSTGGGQYYFVFWGLLISSIYRGWRRYTWLVLLFITIGVLMYIEYTYPFIIVTYDNRNARYFDVYTSFILAMLSTTIIFIIYSNGYRNEHEHVKKYAAHMEKIAITDGLTGLYNHTHLYSCLENELKQAESSQSSLSLIMVDSDHFKMLNDTYGHPTGNLVLIKFADIMRSTIRKSDIAGRYGGDEFLIICPNTTLEEAIFTTEKLRKIVETTNFGESGQIRLTISCGVTTWAGENCSMIIEQVDQALYAAKRSGRNRLEVYRDNIA